MADEIFALIIQYGAVLVFVNVLLTQFGLPLPAVPTLVVAGAMVSNGQAGLAAVLVAAMVACLIADGAWYLAGRRFGGRVMHALCRISLSPDSCVHRSELHFQRWRGRILLIAKFVPALSTVAPPLVGAMGLRMREFAVYDGVGSLLWAGASLAIGYLFAAQVDVALEFLASVGMLALEFLVALLALYVLAKWWQRHRLLVRLRMARVTPEQLEQAMAGGAAPIVVDVRSATSRALDRRIIPGALLADFDGGGDGALRDVAHDRELVVYCNCPHEVTAARAAKVLLERGYHDVRPLAGGLDAWEKAGYSVAELPHGKAEASVPARPAALAHPTGPAGRSR